MAFEFLRSMFQTQVAPIPTDGWPPAVETPPLVDLAGKRIGHLGFGDPLQDARPIGIPDRHSWPQPGYLELIYARAGFQLDFENEALAYVAFFLGPDEFLPDVPGLRYSAPREVGGVQISSRTTRADLIRAFGQPSTVDGFDAHDVVVNFSTHGLVQEFEFNQAGRAKRWNIYPEDEPTR